MTQQEQDAVDKKAADVLAANQKKAADAKNAEPVIIQGGDGAFSIDGPGLGNSGTLTIGGQTIKTTLWSDRRIKGTIAAGVSGAVVLTTNTGVRHGVYPHVKPVVTKTTTVTVETK